MATIIDVAEMKDRLKELKRERGYKLDTLQSQVKHAIEKGYDFAGPNLNLFGDILRLEAGIRELQGITVSVSTGPDGILTKD